jgi:hypothetical protein
MTILFESLSKEPTEYEYNGEKIINFGRVIITDTLEEINN